MSYLIQNIIRVNYTLRLNLRIRATFLFRNYFTIYCLIYPHTSTLNTYSTNVENLFFWLKIGRYLFARFAKILCLSFKYLKQVTFGLSFPKSAHYLLLYYIDNLFFKTIFYYSLWTGKHYLYNTTTQIVTAPQIRKSMKCFIYQIFNYWLNIWTQWSKLYTSSYSFICTPCWWQLLSFTNSFYFKVYNT